MIDKNKNLSIPSVFNFESKGQHEPTFNISLDKGFCIEEGKVWIDFESGKVQKDENILSLSYIFTVEQAEEFIKVIRQGIRLARKSKK